MNDKISIVYRFTNGMCMVFDKNGEQMPEYQGEWGKMKRKIIDDLPPDAEIKKQVSWESTIQAN